MNDYLVTGLLLLVVVGGFMVITVLVGSFWSKSTDDIAISSKHESHHQVHGSWITRS